jgi:hypothetical protein
MSREIEGAAMGYPVSSTKFSQLITMLLPYKNYSNVRFPTVLETFPWILV